MTDEEFDALRPSAFAIGYRMLGTVSEAEDVVQEGFLRLHRARDEAPARRRAASRPGGNPNCRQYSVRWKAHVLVP